MNNAHITESGRDALSRLEILLDDGDLPIEELEKLLARTKGKRTPKNGAPEAGPGVKLDQGKTQFWLGVIESFPIALGYVADCTIQGVNEPGHVLHGWRHVRNGYARYTEAMVRHLVEEAKIKSHLNTTLISQQSTTTTQTLLETAATVAWNSLARLEHLHQDICT